MALFATTTLISFLIPTFFFVENGLVSLLIYFNPVLLILITLILKMRFYTSKQKEIIKQIKGVKNFIRDFTRLKVDQLIILILLNIIMYWPKRLV